MNILRPTWFGRWRARRNLRNVYAKQDAGLKANVNLYDLLGPLADKVAAKQSEVKVVDDEYNSHLDRILKKQREAEARVREG